MEVPSYTCDAASPLLTTEQMVELLRYAPPGPWPAGWRGWGNTNQAHTFLLNEAARATYAVPHAFNGRGIIIAAGGPKYFTCGWVCASVLRYLGCTLPIEFWYLGPTEMDPTMVRLAAQLGVQCVDARAVAQQHPARILCGWELKAYAIKYSQFAEVLFLDADNVPVNNPEYLFDCAGYQEHGAMFWPDLPPSDRAEWVPTDVWRRCDMENPSVAALESGQLLIDKTKCWSELNLALWLNEHSDYYYGQVFGDKDTFLLAWHKTAQVANKPPAYVIPSRKADWNGAGNAGAILQYDLNGHLVFQHRCRPYPNKWNLTGGNQQVPGFVHEQVCFAALEQLATQWHGATWHNYLPTAEEIAYAKQLEGKYTYHRLVIDKEGRTLELLGGSPAGGRIGQGSAEYERRWSVFVLDGIMHLALCHEQKLTCLLREYDGVWRGRWVEHEKAEVELKRL